MLSNKIINFCKNKGWWYEDFSQQYADALLDLGVPLGSDFSQFYLHAEDGPTFYSRKQSLFQICWFYINSSYDLNLKRTHEALKLPDDFLPLDSFEGEGGFFYSKKTGEVVELQLGEKIKDFLKGELLPQWKTFNEFIEWYFELS